ncbi:hypothetical protein [Sphingobacterium shayense]|uniref:hypothetical protein n=1 Tax=Sphingobacterium shayense TaxID=626343 RepID=UPI001C12EC9C|nr:hypothetical protein [Sphingobacterium shayense]
MKIKNLFLATALLTAFNAHGQKNYSGIYPHLAMYNNEGECGTGAVVPWNNKLYVITYGPHLPLGSSDKLYIIDSARNSVTYSKSVGGTPANRMIHKESGNMFIGPYIVNGKGDIDVIDPKVMPGRHTGMARHLTEPEEKVYFATMEEGFYEYDLNTKKVTELYTDVNLKSQTYLSKLPNRKDKPQNFADLFGVHGKGAYSGQGVLVYSNNGESGDLALKKYDIPAGSLSEWDGKSWKLIRRNQFVEVTGPGGINGNANSNDPIWATGWDHKSVILGVRHHKDGWSFYRLPKTSRSYDGAHGWNTEWPRIRSIEDGTSDFLMTMHGMFWKFPMAFSAQNSKGIRPRSAYLKVIGDFARWNNMLVFGCDDSAQKEFLNKRKIKGNLEGAGQSNSNLWFVSDNLLDELGPTTAEGAVWINEDVSKDLTSEPFLLAGWNKRNIWLKNHGSSPVKFTLEIDQQGTANWTPYKTIAIPAGGSLHEAIASNIQGEWIRIKADQPGTYSALFSYSGDRLSRDNSQLFSHIANTDQSSYQGGYLYALADNQRKMGILAGNIDDGNFQSVGYYELDANMTLKPATNKKAQETIEKHFKIPEKIVEITPNSVLVVDDLGRRWRFPKGDKKLDAITDKGLTRLAREVVTERDLMNLHGTFYELPAENADGFAKVRPIASHNLAVHDFASFRGLFIISGISVSGSGEHIIRSSDGKAAVWAGAIDDLWKLGKPKGYGGPWDNTPVKAKQYSDPYLFGFYDRRSLSISHDASSTVNISIQLDPSGNGEWIDYKSLAVAKGEKLEFKFPNNIEARWVRFSSDKDCKVTTLLRYD